MVTIKFRPAYFSHWHGISHQEWTGIELRIKACGCKHSTCSEKWDLVKELILPVMLWQACNMTGNKGQVLESGLCLYGCYLDKRRDTGELWSRQQKGLELKSQLHLIAALTIFYLFLETSQEEYFRTLPLWLQSTWRCKKVTWWHTCLCHFLPLTQSKKVPAAVQSNDSL